MDYVSYFEFEKQPFNLLPDSHFFFDGSAHRRAFSYLSFGLNKGEGFVVITGEIGTGKTTIIDLLLRNLEMSHVTAAKITATQFEADDFLRMVAHGFRIRTEGRDKASIYNSLCDFLQNAVRANRRSLLFVDEAQSLRKSAIEELRMLSNLQYANQSLLQIFLVGQPELRQLLSRSDLEQLRQRVVAAFHLTALKKEEVVNYVMHRLKVAGWKGVPKIEKDCYPVVFSETGGVPRKINKLFDRTLWLAYVDEKKTIRKADIETVIDEMRSEDFATFGEIPEDDSQSENIYSADDLMKMESDESGDDPNVVGFQTIKSKE